MELVYRICVITLLLYDYVIGSSDDEIAGNIISISDSEKDSEQSKTGGLTETDTGPDTDLNAPDTYGNQSDKNGLLDTDRASIYQWHKGVVPYFIDSKIYDDIIVNRIHKVMNDIEQVSCLLFKRLHSEPNPSDYGVNWIRITNPSKERDCVHSIKQGRLGEIMMILGFDCMRETEILHLILHMLGFNDEVQHPQRDLYVRILWDNIQPKYRSLFTIRNVPTPYHSLTEYDTQSIMHFHDRAFSMNGAATIAPLIPGLLIEPSDKFSLLDRMKLRLAFGHECNKRKVNNLLLSCKHQALVSGYDNNVAAGGDSEEDSDSGDSANNSDGGTASANNEDTASGSDGGNTGGSEKDTVTTPDRLLFYDKFREESHITTKFWGNLSDNNEDTASGSDGGNTGGSEKDTVTTPDRLLFYDKFREESHISTKFWGNLSDPLAA